MSKSNTQRERERKKEREEESLCESEEDRGDANNAKGTLLHDRRK